MADPTSQPADEQLLAAALARIRPGERSHEQRVKRYDECYDTYRASPDKKDKLPAWRSRVRVPYAQQVIDTALVNIVSGTPRCLVHPRRQQDEKAAKAMQQLMDYYVSESHLVEEQPRFAQQALIFGVSVAKVHWVYREQDKLVRGPDGKPTQQKIVTADWPCFETWNIYDAWWDPNARDVDSADYIVLRSWMTKRQLMDQAYDQETDEGLYRNLDQLFKTDPQQQPQDTAQESFLGGSQNKRDGMYEILEIWTDDALVVIGNRKVILRKEPNPYWHGKKPIVIAQTRPDLFEMQGVPEVDLVKDIQGAMHTLQNMVIDSLKLTILRGVTYRVGSVVSPETLNLRPLFKWAVGDHDDIRPFEVPQLGSDVYQERQRLLSDLERVTGVSAYLGGADSSTINQTTATGVSAIQNAANTLMRFKAERIHYNAFQRMFEQWGDMIQQFLSHDIQVKLTDPDTGQDLWLNISPQEVVGHYHYKLEGSEESLSKQQERNDAIGLLNALVPLVQMGKVNPDPIIQRIAMSFGVSDPDALIAQQQQLPPAAPFGGGPPGQPQNPLTMMNGQSLPIQQQNQIALR